jgi:copper chaperone
MWNADCGINAPNPSESSLPKESLFQADPVEESQSKEENKMVSVLKVKGMSCQHCVMSVTKALGQLEGIKNVQVDLAKGEVRFDNTKEVASNRIEKAIKDAGYEVVQQ